MSDEIDVSAEQQQAALDRSIQQQLARGNSAPKLKPNGTCHNPLCADDIAENKIFCGAECAKQYAIHGE